MVIINSGPPQMVTIKMEPHEWSLSRLNSTNGHYQDGIPQMVIIKIDTHVVISNKKIKMRMFIEVDKHARVIYRLHIRVNVVYCLCFRDNDI